MIRSMKEIPADFDVQAYGRGCSLQQCEMLTRLAEIGMQLAETAGAAPSPPRLPTQPAAAAATRLSPRLRSPVSPSPATPSGAPDPGPARPRRTDLCARDGGREARRARHRKEVEDVIDRLIGPTAAPGSPAPPPSGTVLGRARRAPLDKDDPVEDRPVSSVVAGLVCGLGLVRRWRRYRPRYENGRRPAGRQPGRDSGRARQPPGPRSSP